MAPRKGFAVVIDIPESLTDHDSVSEREKGTDNIHFAASFSYIWGMMWEYFDIEFCLLPGGLL